MLALQEPERISVPLRGHDFTGLGFNICGNMRDGIFVKDVLHRGPASESGQVRAGRSGQVRADRSSQARADRSGQVREVRSGQVREVRSDQVRAGRSDQFIFRCRHSKFAGRLVFLARLTLKCMHS